MLKHAVLPLLFCSILFSCTRNGKSPIITTTNTASLNNDTLRIVKEYHGIYYNNSVDKTFEECDQPGIIHKIEQSEVIDSLFKKIYPNAYPGQGIYVEMLAEIHATPTNSGPFIDVLFVKECTKAEQKNQRNTCIPSEYWAVGMEPFWQLQISEKENLIDFYNPMEQTTVHFMYTKPVRTDAQITYVAEFQGNKINVVIKKEKCSGAIDTFYDYSANIQLNGRSYSGCAVKQ